MTSEEFEEMFKDIAASLAFEGIELLPDERNMLKKLFMGEINQKTYDSWLLTHVNSRGGMHDEL